jgi:hypothetical protein
VGPTVIVIPDETEIERETEEAVTGAERGPETGTAAVIGTLTAESHAERGTAVEMMTGAVDVIATAAKLREGLTLDWPGRSSALGTIFPCENLLIRRAHIPFHLRPFPLPPLINRCADNCHACVVLTVTSPSMHHSIATHTDAY